MIQRKPARTPSRPRDPERKLFVLDTNVLLHDPRAVFSFADNHVIVPIYVIEAGELNPTQKARNHRHLVDLLHEFISEFETLDHIGFIQGFPPFENETRALRERLMPDYENREISEHIISPEISIKLGPRTLGIFLLQSA